MKQLTTLTLLGLMTMMLTAQHAFEAMIRVTRTLDEMTDTLLRAI